MNKHTSTRLATLLTRPAIIRLRGCFRTLATVIVGLMVGVTNVTGEEPLPKGPALPVTYPKQRYGRAGQGYGLPTFYFDTAGLAPELLKVGPRPPKPFIRELTTGYLLQYSFLSPRPYCWSDDNAVMLSGWEVDKSGGDFEYKPTGEIGKDFAFHSEWFKMVDTNTSAAVTLKHQIARQTDGQITLEFRFRMPNLMDGASWQLRDLEKPGVSLLVQGGNLCWGNGKIVVPLEANGATASRLSTILRKKMQMSI